jgi:hypothetical protein
MKGADKMFKTDRMVKLYRANETEPAMRIVKLIGTGGKVAASVVKGDLKTEPVVVNLTSDADFTDFINALKLTGLVEH